ncbi:carotenoid oxygenase family protein [Pseudomonas sp. LS1212]|uniref:carotenoid oxygenase family protein n=1 Tax=Pseudomonas sp. LS1212 TaxID=2972478 RepID=UPI00215BD4F1|nr:carotenoid oxygenase family protein [Pseudomonas sp. LS1212]UVJ45720.1 carotenoid oxygenase family protein [Pseudomonas sp. LS1212]
MKTFPQLPIYTGFNRPNRMELDIPDLEIEGQLPDIEGAFYRVGPDPHYPPLLGNDIYFNGDGMISMFRFEKGRVSLKTRYARTQKFLAEEKAGRPLFGAYRNPYTDDPSVEGISRSTANTNIFFHEGRLYAMKEDSLPTEMDPFTLETIGDTSFGGKVTSEAFTAHPKYDYATGEMIGFGYHAKGIGSDDVAYYVIDRHGQVVHETWFKVPYANLMHDFGVTEDYVVWPIVPVCTSLERAREGKPVFGWDSSKDVYLAVLPRRGEGKDLRLFRAPNQFCSHVMNAFNDGNKIHFDTPAARSNGFPFFPDITGAPFDREGGTARMTRWTLDLSSKDGSWEARTLSNMTGEFPKIDERYACHSYRHGYLCVMDPSLPLDPATGRSISGLLINAWGHIDMATGVSKQWFCGPKTTLQEPVFVPRNANAPEGDGYLMGLMNVYETMSSALVILDAQHVDEGPIATVHIPTHLRSGLHGNWVPADQLSKGKAPVV